MIKLIVLLGVVSFIGGFLFVSCQPIREFHNFETFQGKLIQNRSLITIDPGRINVIIVADNAGTEIFDLLGPYHMFNLTESANVIVASQEYSPIILRKGLFILPHYTFQDLEKEKISPDIIVIPNLSTMKPEDLDRKILDYITHNYNEDTPLLSVCDGSITAAATGIFDGKLITTHASDYNQVKDLFENPIWVKDVNVTKDGNLYSTAGVSNAVEGSLTVIKDALGTPVMDSVISTISYPHSSPRSDHQSIAISGQDKWSIFKKIAFTNNKRVGVMLYNNISEFHLAAILDTYNRTFPQSIKSFSLANEPIVSQYGLVIIPTGNLSDDPVDEMHILERTDLATKLDTENLVIHNFQDVYVFDQLFMDIEQEYGEDFQKVVKVLLDYN